MTRPSCATCLFYFTGTTPAFPSAEGMCRRHAPRGPVIGCQTGGWQTFPPMVSHQWCGEYCPMPGAEAHADAIAVAA